MTFDPPGQGVVPVESSLPCPGFDLKHVFSLPFQLDPKVFRVSARSSRAGDKLRNCLPPHVVKQKIQIINGGGPDKIGTAAGIDIDVPNERSPQVHGHLINGKIIGRNAVAAALPAEKRVVVEPAAGASSLEFCSPAAMM